VFWQVVGAFLMADAICISILLYMIRRSVRQGTMGYSYGVITNSYVKPRKCTDCTGGVQVLNEDGWGPFTEAQKMLTDESLYLESRSTNVRGCTTCTGRGFTSQDIPNNPYLPPNMGYLEHQRKRLHWPWE
jgi:hypothetical protein